MTHIKNLLIFSLLSISLIGCRNHAESTIIRTADSLLWTNPDSCIQYVQKQRSKVSVQEAKHLQLIQEHAIFKVDHSQTSDSTLQALYSYFAQRRNYRWAGEAKYIKGAYYVQLGQNFEATESLKEAQNLFAKADSVPPVLHGMLYLYLGIACEGSRFFSIANEYYKESLPYFKESKKDYYIASTFHKIGKTCSDNKSALHYLDSASYYALKNNDSIYQKVIEVSKFYIEKSNNKEYLQKNIENLQYLCDSCNYYSYAGVLANTYLENNYVREAEKCLQLLVLDTAINIWSKETYYAVKAEILKRQHKPEEAYLLLKQLHTWQTSEIENSAYASSFIISQKYDTAKEQEMRLQETVKKQRAYLIIVIILLVSILITGYTVYIHTQKRQLEKDIRANRDILKARINERLEVAKQLHKWAKSEAISLPGIMNILSPKQAASDTKNWIEFYNEFNLCYNNVLLRLKEQYPNLSESDLQYIAITYLNFGLSDMTFLLGIEKRTIWNRRTMVKQHLELSEEEHLDNWIKDQMPRLYGI